MHQGASRSPDAFQTRLAGREMGTPSGTFLLAGLALTLLVDSASAQQHPAPRIWDIKLGTPAKDLPWTEFVDPACGTNGGPPGLPLASFAQFAKCPEEQSGLREVSFIY